MAEQDITMKFEGTGDLLPFLKDIRNNVNGLREDSGKAQAAVQTEFKKTADAVRQTNTEFATSSKLVVAIATSAQQGLPALIKNLAQVGDVAEGLAASLSDADRSNFTAVNASLREVAKTQKIIVGDVDAEKKARIDALVEAKKITAEEGKLLGQVQAVVDALKKAGAASSSITGGTGTSADEREAAIQDLVKLGAGYEEAAKSVDKLTIQTALLSAAQEQSAADGEDVFKTLQSVVEIASQTPEGVKALARDLSEAEQSSLDLLVATKGLTKEEAELIAQGAKLKTAFEGADEPVKSLRAQLTQAKQEAFEIGEKFGTGSAQFAAAASKAGKLADEIDHINKVVDAFNPGKKLAAVLQLGEGAVGAFTAINAVVSAIGGDSEETEKALKRVEQGVGFLIGAQSAIRGFTEGWASLKAIIGGVSEVETVNEAVTNAVTLAQEQAAVAASSKAAASEAAAVAARAQAIADEQLAIAQEALLAAQAAGLPINEALTATMVQQAAATEAAAVAQAAQAEAQVASVAATEASVVAAEANSAALAAQTVSTTTATTATVGLSSVLRALWVVMAANPIGVIVAALAAAVGLFLLFSDSAEDATVKVDNLLKRMKFFDDEVKRGRGFRQELADIQQEINNLSSDDTPARQREQAMNAQQAQLDVLQQDLDRARESQTKLLDELDKLDPNAENFEENRKKISDAIDEQVKIIADAGAERVLIEERTGLKIAQINDKEKDDAIALAKKRAEEIKAIREQLADQIAAIEKQLADKIRELTVSGADPRERLKLEREAGEEGIALLEKNLRREIALREIGAAKLIDLSEKEKIALADARIAEGGGQLSAKQDEAVANAKFLLWQDYYRKRADLQSEFDQTLADATGDAQTRELAELDKLLAERAKKLKDAGATPAQIEEDAQRQTLIVQTKFAKDRIDRETQTQVDILEAQLNGGNLSVAQERALQIAILEEKIKGAEKALAIIDANGTDIANAEVAAAKNVIAKLKSELRGLTDNIKPFRLSDLFDLDGEAADRFNEAARSIVDSAFDIAGQLNEAEQLRVDGQIAATDALIDDIHRRGDELQAQLEKDQKANEEGLANNLNATTAAIAANKVAEEKALADKRRLTAEKQKLAKQQAIADTIQQSSSLLTAATSIFKEGALVPGGIFVAIGIVASMVAAFLALKNKIASVTAPQALWKGTKSVELNGAPEGVDTVPAMLTRGEAVVPVDRNAKHAGLVGAIIDDDFSKLTPKQLAPILAQINITPLLAEHGIAVNEQSVKTVVTMNNTHRERVEKSQAVDFTGMERRLDDLTKEVKSFRRQEGDRPVSTTLPDGTVMIETPSGKHFIAPHK